MHLRRQRLDGRQRRRKQLSGGQGHVVLGSTFTNNRGSTGGGLYIVGTQNVVLTDNVFQNNAGSAGGGIYAHPDARAGSLAGDEKNEINNTIRGNTAVEGAALYYAVGFAANGSNDLDASYVCWGTQDFLEVQAAVFDFFDDSSRGIVGTFPLAPCNDPCPVDTDGDQDVDIFDIIDFLNIWNAQGNGSDFNSSGAVDIFDIIEFLNAWSMGCP